MRSRDWDSARAEEKARHLRARAFLQELHAWWQKAQILLELYPKPGRGWHSLRRKFASDLMDQPLKVLCQLGGWKAAKTVLRCYQRADEGQLRKALEDRRRARG